jgi:hypothetical protein
MKLLVGMAMSFQRQKSRREHRRHRGQLGGDDRRRRRLIDRTRSPASQEVLVFRGAVNNPAPSRRRANAPLPPRHCKRKTPLHGRRHDAGDMRRGVGQMNRWRGRLRE